MEPLTPDHVQAALDAQNMGITVRFMEQDTSTAPLAAAALNTELGSIIKSLLFMVDGQPVVVLTAGDQKVHDGKLAAYFNVSRKKVKIATADECIHWVGYAPGGVPPIGHRHPDLTILIDETLSRFETVYAAAGAANTIFPIPYQKLLDITRGTPADVVKEEPQSR